MEADSVLVAMATLERPDHRTVASSSTRVMTLPTPIQVRTVSFPYVAHILINALQTLPSMEVSLTADPHSAEMPEGLWMKSSTVALSFEELETIRRVVVTQSPETLALSMVVMS